MVNPVEFLKIGGFNPAISVAAKDALVWQTHDMMFIGGLAWNWSGRLVKSLSNDAFNELNGRKKVQLGGAPIDQQVNLQSVKEGLFQLAQPYLDASKKHFENAVQQNENQQNLLINKSMELKEKELEATFRLLGKLPAQTIEMILTGLGGGDYESKIETEEDRGLQDEEKHPDRYKPKPTPKETPKSTPPTTSEKRYTFSFRNVPLNYRVWDEGKNAPRNRYNIVKQGNMTLKEAKNFVNSLRKGFQAFSKKSVKTHNDQILIKIFIWNIYQFSQGFKRGTGITI